VFFSLAIAFSCPPLSLVSQFHNFGADPFINKEKSVFFGGKNLPTR
jgi:hypothetical protein